MPESKKDLLNTIKNYNKVFYRELHIVDFLQCDTDFYNRKNEIGHIVSSAILLNKEGQILLIYHNVLKKWMQPGGHVDDEDKSIEKAAMRELIEETGVIDPILHPWHKNNNFIPVAIDSHFVESNSKKNEESHFHHGFMYVYTVEDDTVKIDLEESSGFKWVNPQNVIMENTFLGKSIRNMRKIKII